MVVQYEAIEHVDQDIDVLEMVVGHRKGPWIAAHASLMGYELGHARWEMEGQDAYETYKVRYDADPLLRRPPRVMGKSLREVSELPTSVSHVSGDTLQPEEAIDLGNKKKRKGGRKN